MPTLRERPKRGDLSAKHSSTSHQPTTAPAHTDNEMAGDAIEVRESIEAKIDKDVVMADAEGNQPKKDSDANADADAVAKDAMDVDADGDADIDADADAEGEIDADGEPDEEVDGAARDGSKDLLQLIKDTSEYLCTYKLDGDDEILALNFQRLINKRSLPDYFDVIKEPIAFSTIRAKIGKKSYTDFKQFVRDVTLIAHNAQVYNRPSAPVFTEARQLLDLFKEELKKLVAKGAITAQEAELPDLGPLPEVEDSPPVEEEEEADDDEEEEEEEEDEDEDDSEDESGRRRRGRRGRLSGGRRDRQDDEDAHKKRGRPPRVFTPLEGRMNAIFKGMRRPKNNSQHLLVNPFERLPDKAELPDYYETIKNPIALDVIKRKAKRKKYQDIDQLMADMDLMFENAMMYNEEGSSVYEDAVELQKVTRALAEQEKSKSDEEFRDEDGRLPLASIEHRGEHWKVGDWVHIRNPNDLQKPIIGQLFRTWQDSAGQKWVNACWYYRPEQTVHRFDKFFYDNEVVKSGQYRDHRIEEVEDRCYVMFITRYNKGRPRGFPPDKAVYMCESRYNEDKFRFAKIKTWTSCLPDEVRERDYEMDLFPVPRHIRKVPSPIKHLLQADSKETDDLPKPTWGNPNAPPIIGAVHQRPRGPNETPPPELHPIPPPSAIPQMSLNQPRRPSDVSMAGAQAYRPPMGGQVPIPGVAGFQHFIPRPGVPPGPPQHLQPMPPQITPHQQAASQPNMQFHAQYQQPYTPQHPPPQSYQVPNTMPPTYDPHHRPQGGQIMTPSRPPPMPAPNTAPMAHVPPVNNQYNVPRAPEVYTLPENVEAGVPEEIRKQFHRDEKGRILFFSAPPLNRLHPGIAPEYVHLGHSVSHLANIKQIREERRRKRKERDEQAALQETSNKKRGDSRETSFDNVVNHKAFRFYADAFLDWVEDATRDLEYAKGFRAGMRSEVESIKSKYRDMTNEEQIKATIRDDLDELERKGLITGEQKVKRIDMLVNNSAALDGNKVRAKTTA